MKVTHLLASVSRANGGIAESVCRLAQSLQAHTSTELSVVSLRDPFSEEDTPRWRPLMPKCLPVVGPRAIGYAPELAPTLRAINPDLIHVAGLWMYPSLAQRVWAQRTGRPYIISPHGMLDPWALRNSAWKKKLAAVLFERDHLQGAACLHALCPAEAEAIRAYGLDNPVCVIPNGVDIPVSKPRALAPVWADRVAPGQKVLLFLGRIHPKKGLRELVEAWAMARPPNWRLVVAGWDQGDHLRELNLLVDNYHLQETIHFCGPLHGEAKVAAYQSAQAFILPSHSEGLPMTVLEAWAHGLPVMMTAACNLPEGFSSGSALEISTQPSIMAQEISALLAQPDEALVAMGQRGRQLAAQRFNWDRIAAEMQSVYLWMGKQGPRPANLLD